MPERPPARVLLQGPLVVSTPHRARSALVRGPFCHQKKVQLFGALLPETILIPVPQPPSRFACYGGTGRHVTLTIPKLLRPYFRDHRDLLKDHCRIAHECVRDVMRTALDQPDGMPSIVMAIHTFGEYLDFHPHLHLLMADGLSPRSPSSCRSLRSLPTLRIGLSPFGRLQIFTPCDFITAITQYIPDKSFQPVRLLRLVFKQYAWTA
jgi:hypothetical protein